MTGLGPGREFDLIRRALEARTGSNLSRLLATGDLPAPPADRAGVIGPGDDAAILPAGLAVSTDISVEDVHFRRSWLSAREIGFRAAAAALSDLAAVGAGPAFLLVSTALPADELGWEEISRGVDEAAARVGAAVIGGDLSRSPGPLVLDVTVIGRVGEPLLRSAAVVGDELWVSGPLGAAAAAVKLWLEGREPPPALRSRFARPPDLSGFSQRLAKSGERRAAIDISDGLLADAAHVAAASGVQVVIDRDAVPVSEEARYCLGEVESLKTALSGGEDYELLFTAQPGFNSAEFRCDGAVRIGRIAAGQGLVLLQDGAPATPFEVGHDHFDTSVRPPSTMS